MLNNSYTSLSIQKIADDLGLTFDTVTNFLRCIVVFPKKTYQQMSQEERRHQSLVRKTVMYHISLLLEEPQLNVAVKSLRKYLHNLPLDITKHNYNSHNKQTTTVEDFIEDRIEWLLGIDYDQTLVDFIKEYHVIDDTVESEVN